MIAVLRKARRNPLVFLPLLCPLFTLATRPVRIIIMLFFIFLIFLGDEDLGLDDDFKLPPLSSSPSSAGSGSRGSMPPLTRSDQDDVSSSEDSDSEDSDNDDNSDDDYNSDDNDSDVDK